IRTEAFDPAKLSDPSLIIGANAVQLASTVLLAGYERITRIVSDLRAWTDAHNTTLAAQHGRNSQFTRSHRSINCCASLCASASSICSSSLKTSTW
ncbi:hypothetical protein NE463_21025, partial [Anaerotruncus colihominis]|nr:hypothetical protein [Anaerotruncus colihominis]